MNASDKALTFMSPVTLADSFFRGLSLVSTFGQCICNVEQSPLYSVTLGPAEDY